MANLPDLTTLVSATASSTSAHSVGGEECIFLD